MTELEFHDDFKPLVQLANVNPMLRPIDVEDLSGLPPGMIPVTEIDVLFDGKQAYAQRLREAGVDIEFVVGEGMPHVFTSFAHLMPSARDYFQQACDAMSKVLKA